MIVLTKEEMAEQYSAWVQRNFVKLNKMFGMTFEGLEQRVLSLLAELEIKFLEAKRERKKGKKNRIKKERGGKVEN